MFLASLLLLEAQSGFERFEAFVAGGWSQAFSAGRVNGNLRHKGFRRKTQRVGQVGIFGNIH